jgi:hypothetical protein
LRFLILTLLFILFRNTFIAGFANFLLLAKPKNATEIHDEEAGHHGAHHDAHAQAQQPAQEPQAQRKSSRFSGFFGGSAEPEAIVAPTPVAAVPEKSSRKSKFSLSSQAGRG